MLECTYEEAIEEAKPLTKNQARRVLDNHGIIGEEREEYFREHATHNSRDLLIWLGY